MTTDLVYISYKVDKPRLYGFTEVRDARLRSVQAWLLMYLERTLGSFRARALRSSLGPAENPPGWGRSSGPWGGRDAKNEKMRRASATVCSLGLRASPAMRAALSFENSRPHRMSPVDLWSLQCGGQCGQIVDF